MLTPNFQLPTPKTDAPKRQGMGPSDCRKSFEFHTDCAKDPIGSWKLGVGSWKLGVDGARRHRNQQLSFAISRLCRLRRYGSPQQPAEEADGGQPHDSLFDQSAASGRRGLTRIRRLCSAVQSRRTLLDAPFGCRHPASDEGEALRSADRTLLRIVNFLAVEAKTSRSQLHYLLTACVVVAAGHPVPATVDNRTSGFLPRRSMA
jgi:hypothetical protein